MATQETPASALFDIMKRRAGLSNKDLALCVLSSKPLANGVSPSSRASDRTWLSRYVVHAPVETLKAEYFNSYANSAMKIIARIKASKREAMSDAQILQLVAGPDGIEMEQALEACDQDTSLYRNLLLRLQGDSDYSEAERAEIAMVLLVAAGCTADVREATSLALDFAREIHGSTLPTPIVTPSSSAISQVAGSVGDESRTLGLMRLEDGYVMGSPHWLDKNVAGGTQIGALALGDGAVSKVGGDVSGIHARIWCDDDGRWLIEGLGSKNGTVLVDGVTHERIVVEPPKDEQATWEGEPVELRPGDTIVLGANTEFVIIAGAPE